MNNFSKSFQSKRSSCLRREGVLYKESPLNKIGDKRRAKKEAKAVAEAERAAYDASLKEKQKDLDPAKTSVEPNSPTSSDNKKTRKIPKHGSF